MPRLSLFLLPCAQPVWVSGCEWVAETRDEGLGNQRESVTLGRQCHGNPPRPPPQRKKQDVSSRAGAMASLSYCIMSDLSPPFSLALASSSVKIPFAFKFHAWPPPRTPQEVPGCPGWTPQQPTRDNIMPRSETPFFPNQEDQGCFATRGPTGND